MVDARFLFTALNVGWLRHVSEQPMRRRRHWSPAGRTAPARHLGNDAWGPCEAEGR